MEHDVFISYSHIDKETADELCRYLEARQIRCWIAPRDIPPGESYATQIVSAIEECKVFVFVFSKDSASSLWCLSETDCAINAKKMPIPFRIDDYPLQMGLRLYLGTRHWIDAVSSPNDAYDKLVAAISSKLDHGISTSSDDLDEDSSEPDSEDIKSIRRAAERGDVEAQNKLGDCYLLGKGVSENHVEAVKWYRKAAERGDVEAQNKLGDCYLLGKGVSENHVEAAKWYRKAAEQGHAAAQCSLGVCYLHGNGVEQDSEEAVSWFRLAAEQGFDWAQSFLGNCYEKGRGVRQDMVEAFKWYRKAAEQGDLFSQFDLGRCYELGIGVDKNKVEAAKWYRKAAKQGHEGAKEALKKLEN